MKTYDLGENIGSSLSESYRYALECTAFDSLSYSIYDRHYYSPIAVRCYIILKSLNDSIRESLWERA